MLDAIQKFADSITTGEQAEGIQRRLGSAYGSFHLLMLSKTEDEASERLAVFKTEVKSVSMPELFALHGELTDEQREILEDLL